MTALLDQQWVTARKDHRCTDCGGVIRAGECYQRQTSVDGDGFGTYKAHGLCFALFCDSGNEGDDWSRECAHESLGEWWWRFVHAFVADPARLVPGEPEPTDAKETP